MGPLFVVLLHPLRSDLAHLIERLEDIGIEHFMSHRPIEPFNEGILIGLARLNKPQGDPSVGAPGGKAVGEEFWAIVEPHGLRLASPGRHLLQHPNHSLGGQGGIHFDRQHFSHPFIQNIQGPKPTPAQQGVTHEVHCTYRIRLLKSHQWLSG